jgi:hypothetical protein
MNFCIVFENSGDSIPFTPINLDTLEYFLDNINRQNINSFSLPNKIANIKATADKLHSTLLHTNEWIIELIDTKFTTYNSEEYFDPNVLNKIHVDWAKWQQLDCDLKEKRKLKTTSRLIESVHSFFPDSTTLVEVSTIAKHLNLLDQYRSINTLIHQIEFNFLQEIQCGLASGEWICFDNPYPKYQLTNNIANVKLAFNHLGRLLTDKYMNFDMDLEFDDENSFDELVATVSIHLIHPETIPFSKEYTEWCQRHNRTPIGKYLNIGNITDLVTKIKDYRLIIFRNSLKNNNFSIQQY